VFVRQVLFIRKGQHPCCALTVLPTFLNSSDSQLAGITCCWQESANGQYLCCELYVDFLTALMCVFMCYCILTRDYVRVCAVVHVLLSVCA